MGLLQIVHLEKNEADAAVLAAELKSAGIESKIARVSNETELLRELEHGPVDMVLADAN